MPVLLSSLFQRLVSIVDIFLTGGLGAAFAWRYRRRDLHSVVL